MKIKNKTLKVHFIGIGGVSMSSLARYLKEVGFIVSGSDTSPSENLENLSKEGITVSIGQRAENVRGKDVVVYTDAIKSDNPELKEAVENKQYVLKRAELLKIVSENFRKRLGVCGCHGKTTATCMLVHVFKAANKRFTAHIGGFDLKYGNFAANGNEYFISEVCEYKRNLDRFDADVAICLNIEPDHMDCYKDENELDNTYFKFLGRARKAVIYAGDKTLALYKNENAVTYGTSKNCDFYADDIVCKNGRYSFDLYVYGAKTERIRLKAFGGHNVLNALAVGACAFLCGIDVKTIKRGLENFKGVKRRFEHIGNIGKAEVYADYAHHPTEIVEALKTIKEAKNGKVYTVFQPHTYSRTIFLKDEFVKVLSGIENLILYKTFAAREEYIAGGSAKDLAKLIKNAEYFENAEAMAAVLRCKAKSGDSVLILGAGDLEQKIRKYLD